MQTKGRPTARHFDDLNPTVTYRHLHRDAQSLGVRNPLRVVALCDSDAFYAACEQVRLGLDPAIPLVVQQWDSLIAVNYPARAFGISRMDKVKDAKKRCPALVAVHVATYKEGDKEPQYWENPDTQTHKVSLDHYRRESMKIIAMFKEGLLGGEIEKASIDEAFIDFTNPVREIILQRHPHLAQVPADAPDGIDSPIPPPPPILWNGLGNVIPVHPAVPTDPAAATGEAEALDDGDSEFNEDEHTTWHDVALSIAAELMGKIRKDIYTKLGYSTSAGIARNKFLAKLSASYKKKNQQNILRNAAIPNYLGPMAFQKIRFLGGKLGTAIAEEYDVSTVGDLLNISLEEMQRKFGEGSIWVYEVLRGIDRSEVKEKSAVNKSMLASKNLKVPVSKASEGHHWVRVLAAELALRLNDARESNPGLWPKSLVLHVRQGYEAFRSRQAGFPFARSVDVDVIAAAGDRLWRELVGTDADGKGKGVLKITNVQLAFTGIGTMEAGQRNIEGFLASGSGRPARKGDSPARRKRSRTPSRREEAGGREASASSDRQAGEPGNNLPSFTCERCQKQISLPIRRGALGDEHDTDVEERAGALRTLRLEHDDFHFAQDLARTADPSRSPKKKKIKVGQREPEGIAKYFSKKE